MQKDFSSNDRMRLDWFLEHFVFTPAARNSDEVFYGCLLFSLKQFSSSRVGFIYI